MIQLPIKSKKAWLAIIAFTLTYYTVYSQSGIIQGRLTFANNNVAKGYKVIIVPKNKSNEELTSSLYFYGDDAAQLNSMNARVAFTMNDGKYYFKSIPAGRYILKVCTLNGFRYDFIVPGNNYAVLNIKDLPATYSRERIYQVMKR
jgi:hypothetical protein